MQNRNWSYFIKKLIYFSNNDLYDELFQDGEYDEQKSLVDQTFKNLNYCKQIYENVFDDSAYFFHRKLKEKPNIFVEKMESSRNLLSEKKLKNKKIQLKFLKILINLFLKQEDFQVMIIWQLYRPV